MNTAMKLCAQAVALVMLLGLPLGAAAETSEAPDHDVWWGNRSVSYANYMRFDRIDTSVVEVPEEPVVLDKIFFDLDNQLRIRQAHPVARGGTIHLGVGLSVDTRHQSSPPMTFPLKPYTVLVPA